MSNLPNYPASVLDLFEFQSFIVLQRGDLLKHPYALQEMFSKQCSLKAFNKKRIKRNKVIFPLGQKAT